MCRTNSAASFEGATREVRKAREIRLETARSSYIEITGNHTKPALTLWLWENSITSLTQICYGLVSDAFIKCTSLFRGDYGDRGLPMYVSWIPRKTKSTILQKFDQLRFDLSRHSFLFSRLTFPHSPIARCASFFISGTILPQIRIFLRLSGTHVLNKNSYKPQFSLSTTMNFRANGMILKGSFHRGLFLCISQTVIMMSMLLKNILSGINTIAHVSDSVWE